MLLILFLHILSIWVIDSFIFIVVSSDFKLFIEYLIGVFLSLLLSFFNLMLATVLILILINFSISLILFKGGAGICIITIFLSISYSIAIITIYVKFMNQSLIPNKVSFRLLLIFIFCSIILYLFYGFLLWMFFNFYYFYIFSIGSSLLKAEPEVFFYFFKYDFRWLIFYAWGVPVLFCLSCQCLLIMYLYTSKGGYDETVIFQKKFAYWYFTEGERDLAHLHNIVCYPVNIMSNSFKFIGSYLDINSLDRGLVYLSSLFLVVLLVLIWIESLFFSMSIYKAFWGFWDTECTHFDYLFKFIIKYFILFSIVCAVVFNLFLAISFFGIFLLICCYFGNLFVNYNINSGKHYESIYDSHLAGMSFCMITKSQHRIYHNKWNYEGIYWMLGDGTECKKTDCVSIVLFKGH